MEFITCEEVENLSVKITSPCGAVDGNRLSFCLIHSGKKRICQFRTEDCECKPYGKACDPYHTPKEDLPIVEMLYKIAQTERKEDVTFVKLGADHKFLLKNSIAGPGGSRYKIYKRFNGYESWSNFIDSYLVKIPEGENIDVKTLRIRNLKNFTNYYDFANYPYYIFYMEEVNQIFFFYRNNFEIFDGDSLHRISYSDNMLDSFGRDGKYIFHSVVRDDRGFFNCIIRDEKLDIIAFQRWSPDMKKLEENIPSDFFVHYWARCMDWGGYSKETIHYHQAGVFLYLCHKNSYDSETDAGNYLLIYSPNLTLLATVKLPCRYSEFIYYSLTQEENGEIFLRRKKDGGELSFFEVKIGPSIEKDDLLTPVGRTSVSKSKDLPPVTDIERVINRQSAPRDGFVKRSINWVSSLWK